MRTLQQNSRRWRYSSLLPPPQVTPLHHDSQCAVRHTKLSVHDAYSHLLHLLPLPTFLFLFCLRLTLMLHFRLRFHSRFHYCPHSLATYIHTHIHIYTHIYTYTHVHIYTYTQTQTANQNASTTSRNTNLKISNFSPPSFFHLALIDGPTHRTAVPALQRKPSTSLRKRPSHVPLPPLLLKNPPVPIIMSISMLYSCPYMHASMQAVCYNADRFEIEKQIRARQTLYRAPRNAAAISNSFKMWGDSSYPHALRPMSLIIASPAPPGRDRQRAILLSSLNSRHLPLSSAAGTPCARAAPAILIREYYTQAHVYVRTRVTYIHPSIASFRSRRHDSPACQQCCVPQPP